jgi:hypothetical protein
MTSCDRAADRREEIRGAEEVKLTCPWRLRRFASLQETTHVLSGCNFRPP